MFRSLPLTASLGTGPLYNFRKLEADMGRRSYFSDTPEFYQNFHTMMQNYSIPHEGEPTVCLEMLETYLDRPEAERYERMLRIISGGLQAQECNIAGYEAQIQEL